jgi:hypothetical protein
MSDLTAVSPASGVTPAHTGTAPQPPSGERTTLLPDPATGALDGTDPLSMLYLFESKDRELGVASATKQITALQNERHQAVQQEQQAIAKAIDAQNHHSFWDDLGSICSEVAKVAVVVASVAAAVATLGAATPIAALAVAGAVLSTASFVDGECHVLHSLGVDDATAGWIDTGMAVGGGLLACGAGMAAGVKAATSTLSAISRAGSVVAGLGGIGSGAAAIGAGKAQAQGDQAAADQVAAQAQSDHASRLMQVVVDDTQNADERAQRVLGTIANTKTIQGQTAVNAATAVRG